MRIGVGLPTSTPPLGARHRGPELLAWASRAEAGPFTSLGVTDRLVYDCTDPLVALAAAAAVTTRVRLVTMVVIGPIRPAAVLASQAASLDALSGGRLTLGVSLGARPDDYDAAGASWRGRGKQLSDELAAMREIWEGTSVGPRPARPGGPDVLVGGGSGAAFLRHYYAFTGPFAERVAAGLLDSPKALREQVSGYAEAGCDELVLLPATSDPSELDRLADALA